MREERDVPLSTATTLRLGGPAKRVVRAASADEAAAVVSECDARAEAVLVLGGGSNLVVADEGFDGTVVRCEFSGVRISAASGRDAGKVHAIVDAGAGWDSFVERAVGEGWSGVEALSGIPGSVGATPMQNVGAYGQEVADTIVRVRAFDRREKKFVDFTRAECDFAYRSSRFRGSDRHLLVEVEFAFDRDRLGAPIRYAELARALGIAEGERAPAEKIRETVVRLRRGKGMVLDPNDSESVSAGSFFTNPIVSTSDVDRVAKVAGVTPPAFDAENGKKKLAAAWLIERAGFRKGEPAGPVGISTKHALALVHRGGGTTRDLLRVARSIRDGVKEKLGVELHAEPVMVGCSL
ncbi:MAG TPA: UDP-N-acetylmuramate dehydrogenase [Polyangiaceae bacterium]